MKEDYGTLGLEEGAGLLEVERAYQEKRNLYDIDSLATYSLFGDEDRQAKLNDIQNAYQRILQHKARENAPTYRGMKKVDDEPGGAEQADEPPPMNGQPGSYLRDLRERAGLSLRDVAERTKIGPFQLENIEEERFDKLPAPVYLRGFVLEFARTVGAAEPAEVAGRYLERRREAGGG
ncbi:MAG: helix-turn-helix domain-containing protein [Desulfuromonadales bacterium]|nr:helix-turn-helix domain-containing protein [Desulfuromonadales bacterium]